MGGLVESKKNYQLANMIAGMDLDKIYNTITIG
jgi:hypothetical protein